MNLFVSCKITTYIIQVASVDLSYLLEDGELQNMENSNRNINNNILEVGGLLYLEKKSTRPSGEVRGQRGSDQMKSIVTKFIFGLSMQHNVHGNI